MKKSRLAKMSRRRTAAKNRAMRFEQMEDRCLMTASPLFMGLGYLPGGDGYSVALGVSNDGQTVVGESKDVFDDSLPFRWSLSEGMTALPLPPGDSSDFAHSASADGAVIVGTVAGQSARWEDNVVSIIAGPSGGGYSGAYDVSADGQVVVGVRENKEAYRWEQVGGFVGLGYLPGGNDSSVAFGVSDDGSAVVGWGTNSDGKDEAYRWTQQDGMVSLGSEGRAHDISADSSVVVGSMTVLVPNTGKGNPNRLFAHSEAFRWTESTGIMAPLGDLPGGDEYSNAYAITADGSTIAGRSDSANGSEAFVWDAGSGIRSLQEVLVADYNLDLSGWQLTNVLDMTPDGLTFVGRGTNPEGNTEAFIARIGSPTPGISVSPIAALQTTEAGGTATFEVVLDTLPTADVTIALTSSDEAEGIVDIASLTFTPANWDTAQTFTVTGVDDDPDVIDGDIPYMVITEPANSSDPIYSGLDAANVTLTNIDDDAPVATNAIYVSSFTLVDPVLRGRHLYYSFEVEVRYDTNNNGMADDGDFLAVGVQVVVSLYDSATTTFNSDSNIRNFLGTTDETGVFRTPGYKGLESGKDYTVEVYDLVLDGFEWDPFDVLETDLADNDEEPDGRPDLLFTA